MHLCMAAAEQNLNHNREIKRQGTKTLLLEDLLVLLAKSDADNNLPFVSSGVKTTGVTSVKLAQFRRSPLGIGLLPSEFL